MEQREINVSRREGKQKGSIVKLRFSKSSVASLKIIAYPSIRRNRVRLDFVRLNNEFYAVEHILSQLTLLSDRNESMQGLKISRRILSHPHAPVNIHRWLRSFQIVIN